MHKFELKNASLLLLVSVLGVIGCSESIKATEITSSAWGSIRISPNSPMSIAVALGPEVSDTYSENTEYLRGIILAEQRVGDIHGFTVETTVFNTACTTQRGRQMGQSIVDSDLNFVGVVGPTCAKVCQSASEIFEQAYLTTISPACGTATLTSDLKNEGAFLRVGHSNAAEGQAAAKFAYNELGARRAIVIQDLADESADSTDAFQVSFEKAGGTVVSIYTVMSANVLTSILSQASKDSPDLIFAAVDTSMAAQLTSEIGKSALRNFTIIGNGNFWNTEFAENVVSISPNIYSVAAYPSTSNLSSLNTAYLIEYGAPPTGFAHAFGYDAMLLLLTKLQEVAQIDVNGDLLIDRQLLRHALYMTSNFEGASGTLTCTENGDCSGAPMTIGHLVDNKWEAVYIP
jgi:branched-chain amino acid transport system substrate-binding protein